MAKENKGPRQLPKRPADQPKGLSQDHLWYWVVNQYFEYHGQKQGHGGFPAEFLGRLEWGVSTAPAVTSRELLLELLRQYGQTVWRLNPATPDAAAEAGADANGEGADDPDASAVKADTTKKRVEPSEPENDLFSVAGVTMPPSFTMADANVPGGFRRVLRRYSTLRIMQLDLAVRQMKTAESIAATDAQIEAVARVAAKVGSSQRDELLWQFRDAASMPPPEAQPQPTV